MSVVRWEPPPPREHERYQAVADELAERPGKWALVDEGLTENQAYGSVSRGFRRHGCQVTVRKVGGEGFAVWARWPDATP